MHLAKKKIEWIAPLAIVVLIVGVTASAMGKTATVTLKVRGLV